MSRVIQHVTFRAISWFLCGNIQEARHKTVEISAEFPREQNGGTFCEISAESSTRLKRGTFCGNSTESSTVLFLWNFCGISTVSSTVLSLWKFHIKFHWFMSGFLYNDLMIIDNNLSEILSSYIVTKFLTHRKFPRLALTMTYKLKTRNSPTPVEASPINFWITVKVNSFICDVMWRNKTWQKFYCLYLSISHRSFLI